MPIRQIMCMHMERTKGMRCSMRMEPKAGMRCMRMERTVGT